MEQNNEEIMKTKNFPKLIKDNKQQIQGAQKNPKRDAFVKFFNNSWSNEVFFEHRLSLSF